MSAGNVNSRNIFPDLENAGILAALVLLQGNNRSFDDTDMRAGDFLWAELVNAAPGAAVKPTSMSPGDAIAEFNVNLSLNEWTDGATARKWLSPKEAPTGINWVIRADSHEDGSIDLQIDINKFISYLQGPNAPKTTAINTQGRIVQGVFDHLAKADLLKVLPAIVSLSKATNIDDPEIILLRQFAEGYTKFAAKSAEILQQARPAAYMAADPDDINPDILHAASDSFSEMFDAHDKYPNYVKKTGGGLFRTFSLKTLADPPIITAYNEAKQAFNDKLSELLLLYPDVILGLVAQNALSVAKLNNTLATLKRENDPNAAIVETVVLALTKRDGDGLLDKLENASDAILADEKFSKANGEFCRQLTEQRNTRVADALTGTAPRGGRASMAARVNPNAPTQRSSVAVALEQSSINSKNVGLVYEVINKFYKVTSRETIQTHDINSELQKGFNMNMKDTDRDHMIRLLNEGGNQPFDNKDQMLRAIGELCQQVKRLRNNMAM